MPGATILQILQASLILPEHERQDWVTAQHTALFRTPRSGSKPKITVPIRPGPPCGGEGDG